MIWFLQGLIFNIIASNSQIQLGNNNVQFQIKQNINSSLNEINKILNDAQDNIDEDIYVEIKENVEIIETHLNDETSNLDLIKKSANAIKKVAEGITIELVVQIILNNIDNILNYINMLIIS